MHRTARFVAVIAATSVLAAPAFAETTAENWSKYRHAVMDAMKGHIAAVAMVSFGQVEDTGHLQDHADGLAKAAAELKSLFPAGSGEGSHALPAIWSEPDKFAAAVTAAEKGTAALRDAVQSGDRKAIAAAFKQAGDSCKGCHESFREEHKND